MPGETHFTVMAAVWVMAVAAPSRGQVLDHVGFRVSGLEPWMTHLHSLNVAFEGPYAFGEGRALMLDTPDGLGIELVELPAG